MGAAHRLPGAADGHDRCRRVRGADPDRARFTIALQAARDQVTAARGITDSGDPADIGRIGRAVLADLLPARRPRYSARKVKCSTSRYHVRDQERDQDRPCQSVTITRVQITIRVPPPDRPAARPRRTNQPPGPRQPCPGSRRDHVTRIMASQPGQDWSGSELAGRRRKTPEPAHPARRVDPPRLPLQPAAAGTPCLVRPDRPAPPPTAPDRNPEAATTLLTSGQHGLTTRHCSRSDAAGALDAGSGEPDDGRGQGMGIPGLPSPWGGGRGFGQGWRTGTAWRLPPSLPLSYTRVGTAGLYPAGWCPSLRTRVAAAFTDLTGIVPATASVPVRHRLGGVMWWSGVHAGSAVISAQANPASSRATAVTASPGAFPQLIRCRYLACSRRCAFQDRARVPGRRRPGGGARWPRSRGRAGRPRPPRSAWCGPARTRPW